jgi:hypothetical protein
MEDPISIVVPKDVADALGRAEAAEVQADGAVSISVERAVARTFFKDLALALGPGETD